MNLDGVRTETFTYKKYDSNNLEHLKLIKVLSEDELTSKFFDKWEGLLFSNDSGEYGFIVKKENTPIGIFTISEIDARNVVFSHIIAPTYRGNRYSSTLKKELYQYLFSHNIVDNIVCYIDKNNKNSISSMLRSNPDDIKIANNDMYMVTYKNPSIEKELSDDYIQKQ